LTLRKPADLAAAEDGEAVAVLCAVAVAPNALDRTGSAAKFADTPDELEHFVEPVPATKFTCMHCGR
jgi:hypothetical protein